MQTAIFTYPGGLPQSATTALLTFAIRGETYH